jgi:hypothetical protein
MAEISAGTPPQDRSRIDLTRPSEVAWWCTTLGVSERQLRDAVVAAGPDIRDVRTELGQGRD